MSRVLWDTSAILAYLKAEEGAQVLNKYRDQGALPFVALTEIYYLQLRKAARPQADQIYSLVKSWNFPILWPNERVLLIAGRFKAVYATGIADSYIAALAFEYKLNLVTKDPDYKFLEREGVEVLWI